MAKNGQKTNWLLDAVLFAGLLLSFWLDLTGVGWHQWLGVGLGVLITYHFLVHWKWVEAISQRFFGRTAEKSRLYFLVDAALLGGFYLIGLTGLVISTWLGLELENYTAWRDLHVWASIATLALVVVKIGLHQGWIISTARRYFARKNVSPAAGPLVDLDQTQLVAVPARPAATPTRNGRRDFLVLMGVVGAASLVSTIGVLYDPADSETPAQDGETTITVVDKTSQSQTVPSSSGASSSLQGACTVQCNRRCSYPGNCHRYQDTNGNGHCDWGECA